MDIAEIEAARRKVVDQEWRSLRSSSDKLLTTYEKLQEVGMQLNGAQSSPRIKSEAEAKYNKSDGPAAETNVVDLIVYQEALAAEYARLEFRINRREKFLQSLDPEQVELLAWVYEFRYSINAAADIMNMSRRKATYILQDLREKYYLQQYQDQKPRKFIENPV